MTWKTAENNGITVQFASGASDSLRVVFDPVGNDIAYVVPNGRDKGNANAALIAAAPELFAACSRVWNAVLVDGSEMPDEFLLAAFDCQRAVFAALVGATMPNDREKFLADRRRAQDRVRQQRFRAKKKKPDEATDGTAQG